ncbi:MAG TPA: alpha/beta hydrolase [Marinilabiliaceae bacterium]|nr:alpha/beta hydrolase [Marinilabiliaceae bacterium]
MKKLQILLTALFYIGSMHLYSQEVIKLYDGVVPNSKVSDVKEEFTSGMYRGVTIPTVELFLPEEGKSNGQAVIVIPGGGYSVVVYQGEGVSTARELAKNGITAFVLKYRLPDDATMIDKSIGPLMDVQQAIKLVRENAANWNVNPNKIGVMGFSAGGHLAATAATHFQESLVENSNGTNLRPDFQIVVYPVISMGDALTHPDSRKSLLAKDPSEETINWFSSEMQVTETSPPTYITHAADDKLVDVDNSIYYFEALRKVDVPVEMHIYPKGGHGFIFGHPGWMEPLLKWLDNLE